MLHVHTLWLRWLQFQCSRRQTANNLSWGQRVKLREDLESRAGKVAVPGSMADGHSFVQSRRSVTAAALLQKLCSRRCGLRAEPATSAATIPLSRQSGLT